MSPEPVIVVDYFKLLGLEIALWVIGICIAVVLPLWAIGQILRWILWIQGERKIKNRKAQR